MENRTYFKNRLRIDLEKLTKNRFRKVAQKSAKNQFHKMRNENRMECLTIDFDKTEQCYFVKNRFKNRLKIVRP